MKFNKWTLGLAAVGVVSLASAARADEKMNTLQTALSDTTISGYVSASANWSISPGGAGTASSPAGLIPFQGQGAGLFSDSKGPGKQDGFNLDVVKLSISKPEDESPWASGYQVDLIFGPDAVNYNTSVNAQENNGNTSTSDDYAIKQAYITLRTPIGNGIDWKIGVFDTVIGYEVFDAGSNPNYTRSYGYAVEPTEHTGVLASYKLNDQWSFSAGIANTLSAGINARDNESGNANPIVNGQGGQGSYWHKTLMASATFTAPSSWGWAAGSSIYAGTVYGFNAGGFSAPHGGYQSGYQQNYYLGATVNTPWKQLTGGFAFDYVRNFLGGSDPGMNDVDVYVIGLYATYKATDKLSLNGRAEFLNIDFSNGSGFESSENGYELTATVEYDMWANVITRLEARFDHINIDNEAFDLDHADSLGIYANVIYKF
jgi:hypothetical protein